MTEGSARRRASSSSVSTARRLVPRAFSVTARTSRATDGGAPRISTRSTANTEVDRAPQYATKTAAMRPKASASERPEGRKPARSRRSPEARRGSGTTALSAPLSRRDPRTVRPPPAMRRDSPRDPQVLRLEWRQFEVADEHDLALERHAELFVDAAARLHHQSHAVRARSAPGVLDEVRVLRRDDGASHAVALETATLDHLSCPQLVPGVLEDAAERPPGRGLCRLPLLDQRSDDRLDLALILRLETELDLGHDLAPLDARAAIREREVVACDPAQPVSAAHERARDDVGEVA